MLSNKYSELRYHTPSQIRHPARTLLRGVRLMVLRDVRWPSSSALQVITSVWVFKLMEARLLLGPRSMAVREVQHHMNWFPTWVGEGGMWIATRAKQPVIDLLPTFEKRRRA